MSKRRKLRDIVESYNHKFFDELYENNIEFNYLVNRFQALDEKIRETRDISDMHLLRERLKKHRLQVKDEAYQILLEYKNEQGEE